MAGGPLSLTSGLVFLVIHAAVGVDTSHRVSAAEQSPKATSRVVLGIDAKGGLSYANTQRVPPTSVAEVGEAVAETLPEGRGADREEAELGSEDAVAEASSFGLLEPQPADAEGAQLPSLPSMQGEEALPPPQAADPTSGQPKGMMRREVKRKPTQAITASDSQESSSSLLQVESSPSSPCMTEVKSGGGMGNAFASFKLNGAMINPGARPGFNVLVVSEDWTEQEDFKVFDTCNRRGDNQAMMDFLLGLRDGACILVAVYDDAAMQITSQSKLSLENYGAIEAFNIGFRNAYALIGCKGQPKIEEVLVGADGVTPWLCPERCEWGEWSEWEECSVTCGGGEERRERERTQEGEPGGWPCEGEAHETRECGEDECITTTTTNTTTTTTALMPLFKAGAARLRLCSAIVLAMAAVAAPASLCP